MLTAVDTSVLLDVLLDDPHHARRSEAALRKALTEGEIIVCDAVIAEISPVLPPDSVKDFLADWNIKFVPSSLESATAAGTMFRRYLERGGQRGRVVPDFLIGAHADLLADRLLARDRGYFRDYFGGLTVWNPSVSP